ncbi:cytidine deaminase [Spirochaetia bacterium 38H-sp]|uniref:Cytidine deaminase n=1 Tax=Rarispira pelagica TaxID=3141764 RepID=A0ABU9UDT4_9SPIR
MEKIKLMEKAKEASKKAYAPYSKINVGCAIETMEGEIILGANIENRSYGLTICAERTAIFNYVLGKHKGIKALAIYSANVENTLYPCGACRQVMSEFMKKDTPIICYNAKENKIITETLGSLFPGDVLSEIKPD